MHPETALAVSIKPSQIVPLIQAARNRSGGFCFPSDCTEDECSMYMEQCITITGKVAADVIELLIRDDLTQ